MEIPPQTFSLATLQLEIDKLSDDKTQAENVRIYAK